MGDVNDRGRGWKVPFQQEGLKGTFSVGGVERYFFSTLSFKATITSEIQGSEKIEQPIQWKDWHIYETPNWSPGITHVTTNGKAYKIL